MDSFYLNVLLIVVFSYLLGSIPTAYIVGKLNKVDIFDVGSGNMGATNTVRALGMRWGVFVMAFDMFKGVLAILIAMQVMPEHRAAASTGAAVLVIIGHNWSLFATLLTGTLRGGKGAATAFGTLLVIAPIYIVAVTATIGVMIVARTRYVSLAVLTTFALSLLWLSVQVVLEEQPSEVLIYTVIMGILLVIRFLGNIRRLLAGTERRLGDPS